jgi:hypothetical protein
MFAYRHRTTADDLALHARHRRQGPLHVAVTGSRGLIGRELVSLLTTGGHRVTALVRGQARKGEVSQSEVSQSEGSHGEAAHKEAAHDEVLWDPGADSFDASALNGIDGVVHLAGENIAARRWTAAHKRRVLDSRVRATRVLCEGLARLPKPPKVLVSASAIGFYGDRGDEILDEGSPAGAGFLPEVVRAWEAATEPASAAGIRVVHVRFGVVLSPTGGALAKMLTPFRLGVGGPVGSGRQYWSWIALDDTAGVIYHALMIDGLHGPVNAVAPDAVTNAAFAKTVGRVLSRPSFARLPAAAVRIALGEMADELLLASTRVQPGRLIESQYEFRHGALEDALRHMLGRAE